MSKQAQINKNMHIIACLGCGYINQCTKIFPGETSLCGCCDKVLKSLKPNWESRVAALLLTSIILFMASNLFEFLSIEVSYRVHSSNLLSGVFALFNAQQPLLALLVLVTIFIFPLFELLALSYIFVCKFLDKKPPGLRLSLIFLEDSKIWNMLDIFMVGVLITAVKLGESATLTPEIGLLSFALLIVCLIVINLHIDFRGLWNWYQPEQAYSVGKDKTAIACKTCHATVSNEWGREQRACPRCRRKLHLRVRHSMQKTTALLVAAVILYIPALMLPIMTVVVFGVETQDTILSGVIHLLGDGLWFIGMVVFIASILVPILKLCVLGYLLWSVYHQHTMHRRLRHRLLHLIEFIGRWSMIDVFVITLLVALVQFGVIVNIRAEPAALAFASVVIITMMAVETFDSRLLWDENSTTLEQDHDGK